MQSLRETVRDVHVAAVKLAHQLLVVVAKNAERVTCVHHGHDQPEDVGGAWSPIDQIAEKEGLSPVWMEGSESAVIESIAESLEQAAQLVEASMHIADDVEGAMLAALVGPQGLAPELHGVHRFGCGEGVDLTEALAAQAAEGTTELAALLANDVHSEPAVWTALVPRMTELRGEIEHDRHGQDVEFAGEFDERLAILRPHAGRVDH